MSDSSKFQLSVWAPFVPQTALVVSSALSPLSPEQAGVSELTDEASNLHKEVFRWRMVEDAFGGVTEEIDRKNLKKALLETMAIDVHPAERSINALRNFVDEANRIIEKGQVEWNGSQDPLSDEAEEARVNSLLALVNHLSWLVDVFSDQPGVSVSVR